MAAQCRDLIEDIRKGIFSPVYLLMGEESYYPDLVCKEIIDNCIDESSKDFNELICYGADANADAVICCACALSSRVLWSARKFARSCIDTSQPPVIRSTLAA